jgi:hypothetical protein
VLELSQEWLERTVNAVVGHSIEIDNMGLLIGPLGAVISGYGPIVVELYPFGLFVEPIANWDVEVTDLPVIELIPSWGLVEALLVMEYMLFKVVDAILVLLGGDAGVDLTVGNGL